MILLKEGSLKIKHPSLPKQNWLGLHSTIHFHVKARSPDSIP